MVSLSLFIILILSGYVLAVVLSPTLLHPILLFVPECLNKRQPPLMPREDLSVGFTLNKRSVLSSAGYQTLTCLDDVVACLVW